MRESTIEAYLRDQVKAIGGKAYKFISPGNNGVPDRLVCLPGGRVIFVELKAPGKKPTALQLQQQAKLRTLGFRVWVIDSKAMVDNFIAYATGKMMIDG
nr:VRR-NUC domain-containing protein [uncultured Caproiciproducens sp.]